MNFINYLDESNIGYLLMIVGFLLMARRCDRLLSVNNNLQKQLKNIDRSIKNN